MTVTELAVLVEHPEVERIGVLAAELEDVAHLDAAGRLQHAAVAVRAGVAVADLGGLDGAVGREVAAGDDVERVAAGRVGARHPAGPLGDPGVDDEPDAGGRLGPERPGTDVALHQGGVLAHLGLVHGLDLDRLELALEPLLVDLAVAGHADRQRLTGAVGVLEHDQDVLEGVAAVPGPVVAGVLLVEERHQRVDGRGVGGLLGVRRGHVVVRHGRGRRGPAPPRRWRRSRSVLQRT